MTQRSAMKLIPALMLAAFSGAVGASGFQLLEQNLSGLGNAYAGSAAVAENASTIYYNPAGMTQLQDREISGGLGVLGPSFKFSDSGSNAGPLTFPTTLKGTGNGGDAGGVSALPNGYISWGLTRDLYAGLGLGAPFGLKTEYDNPWVGAAQSTLFEIKTYNVNPSVAYRVSDKVSLGIGLDWQRLEAKYDRAAGIFAPSTSLALNLNDDAWGWNAGALFTLSPTTKVGVSYRSAIKYDVTGDLKMNGVKVTDAKASIKLPDTAILSVTQQLSDKWQMMGDISWTGWSSIPKVDILTASGLPLQTLDTKFKDTWRVALGATYKYNDAWKLKYGIAYDQTPVRGPESRLVSLPDNDRIWLSLGAQWAPSKASTLDLGVAYIHVKDASINNDQSTGLGLAARGIVTGEYTGSIWVLGAQYSMSF